MVWRRKSGGGSGGASPCCENGEDEVPRGHVPMVAGGGGDCGDGGGERVMVPVRLLGDPSIAELLDMAAQQYGFGQPGVLRVPCDAGHFRRVVESKSGGGGASPSRDNGGEDDQVPRGHVPMVAGCGGGDGAGGERVMVPVRLLGDPCIAELLDMAAQQYGYGQPGVLRVPCDAGHFRRVVERALRKDGGRAKLGAKTLICTRLPTTLEEDLAFW
uniref:Auxin responsive protein n=1 Tax=Oryza glumipatula TaxID=40148 RepID=A0A0D9ZI26_9ORYZ